MNEIFSICVPTMLKQNGFRTKAVIEAVAGLKFLCINFSFFNKRNLAQNRGRKIKSSIELLN
jgi:hypothetical protein